MWYISAITFLIKIGTLIATFLETHKFVVKYDLMGKAKRAFQSVYKAGKNVISKLRTKQH